MVATGQAALDALLPDGGWPLGRLTELLPEREGIGEVGLLVPALARLSCEGRWVVWVSPPHWPYGPALAAAGVDVSRVLVVRGKTLRENLWAAEQALGSGACGAVAVWAGEPDDRALRRLQLAAEKGRGLALLFRSPAAADQSSPARLRLGVDRTGEGLNVRILKGRGGEREGVVLGKVPPRVVKAPKEILRAVALSSLSTTLC